MNTDGHLHTEDHCPDDFKSENRHIFHAVTGEDDDDVRDGKCAIQSAHDDSFLRTKGNGGQMEKGDNENPHESEYHFVVTYVSSAKVNIFSVGEDKYLKLDGHHAKAKAKENCGDACQFTIEEEVSASDYPQVPDPQGILKNEI